ncbi:CHASE2 domain-containing protein [Pararobbsia alpina]|uniref:histidine kinase n=1 Tax=Pararobbsia alpina TaxID=621374 RepID=A0A6S7BQV3_9BURK|nr:CHASE2 domain-containing protein [Pararobbsia alpina]CAB3799547.1 Adaptive-response sensory-kinase SasA [Pararobbsia alpina]
MDFDAPPSLGRSVRRRFIVEWLAVVCLGIIVIVAGAAWRMTTSVDRLVYDHLLSLRPLAPSSEIVVVTIDNASIAALGRWPWPRSTHARLLDTIAKAQPAAVVYDVLFTEPAEGDGELAAALAATPTYLPVLLSPVTPGGGREVVTPEAQLSSAAAGLGHINLEVDGDGIVRSVALFEGDARWPQLMMPVYRDFTRGALVTTDQLNVARGALPDGTGPGLLPRRLFKGVDFRMPMTADEVRFLIPFSPLSASYATVSFVSLLAGEAPEIDLHGKIVVIGVTASGLYDRFATPVSGQIGPLPGVFTHANVLDMLLNARAIDQSSGAWLAIVSLLLLAVLLAGFLMLSPWRSLALTVGLCVVALAGSAALLYYRNLWMSPVPPIAGLVVVYPIWSWRRLEMTMSYLRRELQRFAEEPNLLPDVPHKNEFGGDELERHMALMARAAQRMQDMKRFVWDSLDSVPAPILVSDLNGVVLIANQAAKAHFRALGEPSPEGRRMSAAFEILTLVKTIDASAATAAHLLWPAALDPTRGYADVMKDGVEVRDREGRDHLLRYATCTNAEGSRTGWIAGLVDVTELHAAERRREDALRFLSHDMRSPQASILALVELERPRIESDNTRALLDRIERYAQRALTLADDFVQLERAESQRYELEPVSFVELVIDACDEVWPQAQAKRIHIDTPVEAGAAWVNVDPSLMTRALVNILNNAIKYSPPDTRIACRIVEDPALPTYVQCMIRDEGYGIPLEQQKHLFERFRRFHTADRPEVGGAGLGMAFVKIVVTRHGGEVRVRSVPGQGTTFTVSLPSLDETPDDGRTEVGAT